MTSENHPTSWESRLWIAALAVLVLCRLPAFVAPAGSDQQLYMYVADRILAGGAPYVDAWDQKPPGVHLAYAALRTVWAATSTVALMDLITAIGTAAVLVVLGRRFSGPRAGYLAATVFLLFGDPSIARLNGLYLRGQCETLIALAIAAALARVDRPDSDRGRLISAGALVGAAVWVKYNAVAYALPLLFSIRQPQDSPRRFIGRASLLALGALVVSIPVLAFLGMHGALHDWWLATIDYNLLYSGETYSRGWLGAASYAAMMPVYRAKMDFLWFLGAVGVALVLTAGRTLTARTKVTLILWLVATLASILLNGARDLPQYFLQAKPALALTFAVGAATLSLRGRFAAIVTALVLAGGLWRVGTDAPGPLGLRWAGLPQAIENLSFDVDYALGRLDRGRYLSRFAALQKYDAAESDALAMLIQASTLPAEPVFVFGFSPAVYLESERRSASRFFWSRPVILEFAAEHAGYGSRGLLGELERDRPSIVALQKKDWGPGEPTSYEFMLTTPHLRSWLETNYAPERETPFYSIWRRKP